MATIRLWIDQGCTISGLHSDIWPEVYTMKDEETISQGIFFTEYEEELKEADENLPAEDIKHSE